MVGEKGKHGLKDPLLDADDNENGGEGNGDQPGGQDQDPNKVGEKDKEGYTSAERLVDEENQAMKEHVVKKEEFNPLVKKSTTIKELGEQSLAKMDKS